MSNYSDPVDIDTARYIRQLEQIDQEQSALEDVGERMRRDSVASLQGANGGIEYARVGSAFGRGFVCRQDALEIFESMLECYPVGDAFFNLMQTEAAKPFIEAWCDEYVNRYAPGVVDVEMKK